MLFARRKYHPRSGAANGYVVSTYFCWFACLAFVVTALTAFAFWLANYVSISRILRPLDFSSVRIIDTPVPRTINAAPSFINATHFEMTMRVIEAHSSIRCVVSRENLTVSAPSGVIPPVREGRDRYSVFEDARHFRVREENATCYSGVMYDTTYPIDAIRDTLFITSYAYGFGCVRDREELSSIRIFDVACPGRWGRWGCKNAAVYAAKGAAATWEIFFVDLATFDAYAVTLSNKENDEPIDPVRTHTLKNCEAHRFAGWRGSSNIVRINQNEWLCAAHRRREAKITTFVVNKHLKSAYEHAIFTMRGTDAPRECGDLRPLETISNTEPFVYVNGMDAFGDSIVLAGGVADEASWIAEFPLK